MAPRKKYLTSDDRYEFLLDRVELGINQIIKTRNKHGLEWLEFNGNGVWKQKLPINGHWLKVLKKGRVLIVSITFKFNMNRDLRERYKQLFGIGRYSKIIVDHGDSVLPAELRQILNREKITLARARRKGFRRLETKITAAVNEAKKELIKAISEQIPDAELLSAEWISNFETIAGLDFLLTLYVVEIDNDIFTNSDPNIVGDPEVIERFNEIIIEYNKSDLAKGFNRIPTARRPGAVAGGGKKEVPYLKGWHDDGSEQKLYLKHVSKFGVITRAERAFEIYHIQRALKYAGLNRTATCTSFDDLVSLINFLGKITFEKHHELLNAPCRATEKRKHRLLKELCYVHFGEDHAKANQLLKSVGAINTSRGKGTCPRSIAKRALEIGKQDTWLRRAVRPRGLVVPNWNWILGRC